MSIITLWNVLNNTVVDADIKRGIEIPMIQRDYAQGRKNSRTSEIRRVFLNKILTAINDVVKEDKRPLELDFIYGYLESETFIPLDGQQRLTTLYLLHWYFAFKEQKLVDLKIPFSRFTYQTRQSSEDFLNKINTGLTQEDYNEIFINNKSFESVLIDKNWYYVSWKYDLTIQSAITMLDEIHCIFSGSEVSFSDLTNEEKPCIVFNFLDIKNFGLSDDLYIKMNSRGKPLTNFENLKAELGKFIELSDFNNKYEYTLKHSGGFKRVDVETYFVTKIDTFWADYFWKLKSKETNEFDDKLLNLLAFVSLNETAKETLSKFDICLKGLDQTGLDLSYYKFKSLQLLNENSIISYIEVLDILVSDNQLIKDYLNDESYLDKKSIIAASYENSKITYEQRVLFYAIFKFLVLNKEILTKEELAKWDRLIRNLVSNRNTIYNTPKDFQDSILSIDSLLEKYTGNIYQTFMDTDIKGFDSQQIKEEKLKLELLKSNKWHDLINEAESHPYLTGQIIFLMTFSGIYDKYLAAEQLWNSNDEEIAFINTCVLYFHKFKKLFTETGLRHFDDELFRRALLTKGDYLLYSTNWSLVIDNHRDISWKRLLKETGNRSSDYFMARWPFLKELFDDIEVENVESTLKRVIKENDSTDWRKDFIDNPILMKSSKEKYLKFHDHNDNVFVLRKSKYNKYADPEIKSILLKESLMKKGFDDKDIELGFVEALNQFGIIRIKNLKPKMVYNHDGNKQYFIKQKGKDDQHFNSKRQVEKYILENF